MANQHSVQDDIKAVERAIYWPNDESDEGAALSSYADVVVEGQHALERLEEQLETLKAERDEGRRGSHQRQEWERRARDAEKQFDALARIGWGLVYDNMHFHERAMADPFEAESYVQSEGQRILDITGMPKGVRVLDVSSNPASEPESA